MNGKCLAAEGSFQGDEGTRAEAVVGFFHRDLYATQMSTDMSQFTFPGFPFISIGNRDFSILNFKMSVI